MDEKISVDLKSIKFIYNKNKSYIFPVVVILISLILFVQFVIPQFGALQAAKKEANELSLKIEALKANLEILSNIDENILDSQFRIVTLALPMSKDFIGILNSIYSVAQKTGVSLGNFSLKIGDLAQSGSGDNFPAVKLLVPVNSDIVAINSFIEQISKTMPLVEVYSATIKGASSRIGLSFYYKSLDASSFSQADRVSPVSQKGLTLIDQLKKLSDTSIPVELSAPRATSSAAQ